MELFVQFQREFVTILTDGGPLMVPLTMLSLAIYGTAFAMYFYFGSHRFYKVRREDIERFVQSPESAQGEIRQIIDYTQAPEVTSSEEVKSRFEEVHNIYLAQVDSKRGLLLTMVTTAPLMGLLGTVMGMLTTFSGLAVATGGKTVDQIAAGISEALITTQTGLIIAIPAYVLASMILRRRNQLESCLTALEAFTVQKYQKLVAQQNRA